MAKGSGGGGGMSRPGGRVTTRGAFVTDGLVRGLVIGRGTIGRNTPAVRLNIGGGRTTVVPVNQLRRIA